MEALLAKLDKIESLLEVRILPEFLTVKDAAKLLRCSDSKIRVMLRDGQLKFSRLSDSVKGTILIKRKDIKKLMK
jgi:excisionase family DNA binding protein